VVELKFNLLKKRRSSLKILATKFIIYLILLAGTVVALFPFLWMASSSFKSQAEIFSTAIKLIPSKISSEHYKFAFDALPLWRNLFNTALVSTSLTFLSLFFCSLAGFAFAKYSFPAREPLFYFLLATMMIPGETGLVAAFIVMNVLHWVDTYWALIIPGAASAFGIFFMRQYMLTVPNDILEAAIIDGCSPFEVYLRIVLPLVKPAIAALGIMTFMYSWNDFLWPLIVMRSPEKFTLMVAISSLVAISGFSTPWGAIMAGCTFAILPLIVVFLLFQRQFVSGIMLGAVKR